MEKDGIIYYSNFFDRLLNHNDISTETLQRSIFNIIKTVRRSKKHTDELTAYTFVKKQFQLIANMDINNTLKKLSEIGRKENKPSKSKSSYFLIDNNITDPQPHMPKTMATPLIKTSSFTHILSPSAEDQINSFVSSDIENDNNNSLETLNVINNAYKYVKYKKNKVVLLPEIKNDTCDFI